MAKSTKTAFTRENDVENILLDDDIIEKWQKIVNLMGKLVNVPVALIMKVDQPYIEVFISSESKGNPYKVGDREHLTGLYCEKVITREDYLLVPNALKDQDWNKNPDVKLGMISYLGYPILYPDGSIFGTICVLDTKENKYSSDIKELIFNFSQLVEQDLSIIEMKNKLEIQQKNTRVLFDSATTGIAYHEIIYDSSGKPIDYLIKNVNSQYEEILSIKKEKVVGKPATKVYKTEKAPYLDIYSNVSENMESISFETFFEPMNKFFRISVIAPVKGEFITIFDDISEEKIAQVKLKESQKKYKKAFERANFYRELFTHDISNIIQIIHSSVDIYLRLGKKRDKSNKKDLADELMNRILKNTEKAIELIKTVRKISKIDESLILPLEQINFFDLLNDAIYNIQNAFKEKNIEVMIESKIQNYTVLANELLLEAFENILNNGIKYNMNDEVKITINISQEENQEKNYFRIEIMDNGIGIKDQNKEKIFKKGQRRIKGAKGMGIGLSLVKELIEGFNGKIWVENRIKTDYTKGSKFIILLPEI
jgi:signal transduction histidine kinase